MNKQKRKVIISTAQAGAIFRLKEHKLVLEKKMQQANAEMMAVIEAFVVAGGEKPGAGYGIEQNQAGEIEIIIDDDITERSDNGVD